MADNKEKLEGEQLKDVNGGGGAVYNDNSGDVNTSVWIGDSLETPTTSEQGAINKENLLF